MKHFLTILVILLVLFSVPTRVSANTQVSDGAAMLSVFDTKQEKDMRVAKLKAYLAKHNSPIEADADHFVSEADRLNLDWKLVAAIAGVESTFGKHIPPGSYNGWGWAVYTGMQSGAVFRDWRHAITTVSEGLRYNYLDKGAETIDQIGRRYAASPRWATNVKFFLAKIEAFTPDASESLEVTL